MEKKLSLLWQSSNTRKWYHIGDLTFLESKHVFEYNKNSGDYSLKQALEDGYSLHPSFPNQNELYESTNLFNCFARRIPNFKRNDIKKKYEGKGLDENSDPYDVFSITGGRLAADNYELLRNIREDESGFSLDFYLRGWRYYNESELEIIDKKLLKLSPNPEDKHDVNAINILYNGQKIGNVPAFYSPFLIKKVKEGYNVEITDFQFNKSAPFALKLYLEVKGSFL